MLNKTTRRHTQDQNRWKLDKISKKEHFFKKTIRKAWKIFKRLISGEELSKIETMI